MQDDHSTNGGGLHRKLAGCPALSGSALLVSLGGVMYGFVLIRWMLAVIRPMIAVGHSEIVSWVTVHAYPKELDYFHVAGLVLGLPAILGCVWSAWVWVGRWYAGRADYPPSAALRLAAIPFLMLGLAAPAAATDLPWPVALALPPLLVFLVGWLLLYVRPTFSQATPGAGEVPPANSRGKTHALQLQRWVEYGLIPLCLYLLFHASPGTFFARIHGGIDWEHEGERVAPLETLERGGLPYRDSYLQHGFIQNAGLPWLATKVYGDSLAAVRRLERRVDPLGYIAIYLLGLQLYRGRALTALLAVLFVSGSSSFVSPRVTLGLLSLVAMASWVRRLYAGPGLKAWRDIRLPLAFFVGGCSFWYSAEVGIYTLTALTSFILILAAQRIRDDGYGVVLGGLIVAGIAGALGLLCPLAPLLYLGVGPAFFDNVLSSIRLQGVVFGMPMPPLEEALAALCNSEEPILYRFSNMAVRVHLFVGLMSAALVYVSYRIWAGRFSRSLRSMLLLLLALAGLMYFRTAIGRSLPWQIRFGTLFFWPVVLLLFDAVAPTMNVRALRGRGAEFWGRAIACVALVGLILVGFTCQQVFSTLWARLYLFKQHPWSEPAAEVQWPRVGAVEVGEDQIDYIKTIAAEVDKRIGPDEPIFLFSNKAAHYYLLDRAPITRFFFLSYAATQKDQEEIMAKLESNQVPLILDEVSGGYDGLSNRRRHPLLFSYIEKNYEAATVVDTSFMGPIRVLVRATHH